MKYLMAVLQPLARRRKALLVVFLWIAALTLLYVALRGVSLVDIASTLRRIGLQQVLALMGVNALILGLIALRWWLLLRSMGGRAGLLWVLAYRLAGYSVSFITPGTQFGGEPLQVDLLRRKHDVPLAVALSSVYLDRLIEVLVNFTFLAMGLAVVLSQGVFSQAQGGGALLVVLALLMFPLAHLAALAWGKKPLTALTVRVPHKLGSFDLHRLRAIVWQAELQIGEFCYRKPRLLVGILLLSCLIWGLMIFEYALTLTFLGVRPQVAEVISALTAARLSLLIPVPGGLGALEASQVIATQMLGWGAATGGALTLMIRARDLSLAALGLAIGWFAYRGSRQASPMLFTTAEVETEPVLTEHERR